MIVWLASYPRSGNTMLRMILKSVFGIETYSEYNDINVIGANENMVELVGHKMLEESWEKTYQKMKRSDQLFFVKTHDYPEDDSKAIYIVRDGRSSIVSYYHYLKDFIGKEYPLSDVIAGFVSFSSWAGHLDVWNPISRPNTLFIHYERLLTNPDEEIERIENFLGLCRIGDWRNNFEYFHKINPRFFREGDAVKGIKAIKGDDLDLFWSFHGDWMNRLGYKKGGKGKKCNAHRLREITYKVYERLKSSGANCNLFKAENDKLVAEREKLIAEKNKLITERDNLVAKNDKLTAEKDALFNSLIWKVTALPRAILKFLKR